MNEYDLVYMAGFFDGEGHICIGRGRRLCRGHYYLCYQLEAGIAQSGKKGKLICEWFKSIFNGYIKQNGQIRNKYSWNWKVSSNQALLFLKQIYPYLKIKKEQANLALEFQEKRYKYEKKKKNWFSEFDQIERFSYFETVKREIQFLNGRIFKEVSWMTS